jgi:hypothetical protein
MGLTFGHRNNNDTNNATISKNTTNSSERQFDPYNICNFTVDLRPNRCLCHEARPRHVLLSRTIYVATTQHRPQTHQRASHQYFHCHTHTVTSALKVAYLQTYRTNHCSLYRRGPTGSPSTVLNLPQTSDFVKQKQKGPGKV